jgi:alkaline phosphatase
MLDFDRTVGSVIDWVGKNGGWEENLLIVTADHDHYLTLNGNYPTLVRSKGAEALTTVDTVSDAGHLWGSDKTTKYGWGSHSNRPVPVYYQGAGAKVLDGYVGKGYESYGYDITGFPGHVDQSHIYQTMLAAVTGSPEKPLKEGPQTVFGLQGDDMIYTGAFDDVIYGNEGVNEIFANNGNNRIYGGSAADLVYTGSGKDVIFADEGENNVFSGDGDDQVYGGSQADYIYAGAGDDLIYANEGKNIIDAGPGNDRIYGGSQGDRILAGAGNDLIYANGGDNFINAGLGDDQVWTGGGADTFVLNTGAGFVTIQGYGGNDRFSLGTGLKAADLIFSAQSGDTIIKAGDDQLALLKGSIVNSVSFI